MRPAGTLLRALAVVALFALALPALGFASAEPAAQSPTRGCSAGLQLTLDTAVAPAPIFTLAPAPNDAAGTLAPLGIPSPAAPAGLELGAPDQARACLPSSICCTCPLCCYATPGAVAPTAMPRDVV
ncbi:MAG TPA: hypothetical protein VFS60_05060 [Thermoanaerobaculia bacterium]|nr:hypothetical protein [Thermoanaerobaculia bacterium]